MKLNRITGGVYYIDAAVNMGLMVSEGGEALLVDTGIDDSVARKVNRVIEAEGFRLTGIIITHAHADHCGGAPHLVKVTGAGVYAPAVEKSVFEFPLWEPAYLFSGAYPPPPMLNKFLLAPGVMEKPSLRSCLRSLWMVRRLELKKAASSPHLMPGRCCIRYKRFIILSLLLSSVALHPAMYSYNNSNRNCLETPVQWRQHTVTKQ